MKVGFLRGTAVFCQLLSLFPFVIMTEGLGYNSYTPWHYAAVYGAFAVFYVCGRLCSEWANRSGFSRRLKPVILFLSRAAVSVPVAAFIIVCVDLELSTGLYMYTLPASVIAYFGGYSTRGREYSDIYTGGWFALFFVSAIVTSLMMTSVHDEEVRSSGIFQLCFAFGLLIVISAVLANQTNIDTRARQRSSDTAALPKGLRAYNAGLISGVAVLIVGLCLFSGPAAHLISAGIIGLIGLLLSLIRGASCYSGYEYPPEEVTGGSLNWDYSDAVLMEILSFLFAAALVVLAVKFRRQIFGFLKGLFAPLFRESAEPEFQPYYDEVTDTVSFGKSLRSRRRTASQLYRRFMRETDPSARYRTGYALFMLRLAETPFPYAPSDTTTVHRVKGEQAFRAELSRMVGVYNAVRYGERVPTPEELSELERVIKEITLRK